MHGGTWQVVTGPELPLLPRVAAFTAGGHLRRALCESLMAAFSLPQLRGAVLGAGPE